MDNIFDMRLAAEPFEKIGREEKTVEIRLYDEKRRKIKVDDKIVFRLLSDESNVIIVDVKALHRFNTFQELFSSDLFSKTGCGEMTIDSATEYMYKFYSREQEKQFGVLGIEISMDEELTLVYGILKEEYKDCDISDDDIMQFAQQLNDYVFVENCDLNDILILVYEFEEAMRDKGAIIEVGRQCIIYLQIINHLDINEENAKRLYESFVCYHDCQAFSYLMNEFEEWITPEQRDEVLSIARGVFIESVWEDYV
ncbi:MAG: ASCH domain-containing protein [Roseburia sp.]|nr:ASCH domain-containing protein [Roseburia sp.]